jgi:hypothetical protein
VCVDLHTHAQVDPLLNVLVSKLLEQSLLEVEQENELSAIAHALTEAELERQAEMERQARIELETIQARLALSLFLGKERGQSFLTARLTRMLFVVPSTGVRSHGEGQAGGAPA